MYTFGIWDFQANLSVFSICQSLQILRCNPPSLFFTTGSTLQLNSNLCLLQNKSCQQNKAIAPQILHSARFNNCYQIFLQNIQSCFFSLFLLPPPKNSVPLIFLLQMIIFDVNTVLLNKMRNKCHISTMGNRRVIFHTKKVVLEKWNNADTE